MTVLITDAGMVGTHVAKTLLDQGVGVLMYDPSPSLPYVESVTGLDRKLFRIEEGDVRDVPRILDLMLRLGVTRIFHPIGATAPSTESQPSLAFQVRVSGTLNLIEAARIRSLSRIVIASSADQPTGAAAEHDPRSSPPPESFDGALDVAAQTIALAYHRWAGVNVLICRVSGLYGRQAPGRGAFDPIQQALATVLQADENQSVTLLLPARERVYVKDAALALREAIFVERPTTRSYDIGSGELVGSAALAAAIQAAVPSAQVDPEPTFPASVPLVDDRAARQDLAYQPTWSVTSAVADMVGELRAAGDRLS